MIKKPKNTTISERNTWIIKMMTIFFNHTIYNLDQFEQISINQNTLVITDHHETYTYEIDLMDEDLVLFSEILCFLLRTWGFVNVEALVSIFKTEEIVMIRQLWNEQDKDVFIDYFYDILKPKFQWV